MKTNYYPIETCDECHWFDNDYNRHFEYHYRHYCDKLQRPVERNEIGDYIIPEDCPLENWSDTKKKYANR